VLSTNCWLHDSPNHANLIDVHKMLATAAAAVAEVVELIKTLVTLAMVVHFDETTLRAGKAGVTQYVWSTSTGLYTLFTLGQRGGRHFRAIGIGPAFAGVALHESPFIPEGVGPCQASNLRKFVCFSVGFPDR